MGGGNGDSEVMVRSDRGQKKRRRKTNKTVVDAMLGRVIFCTNMGGSLLKGVCVCVCEMKILCSQSSMSSSSR